MSYNKVTNKKTLTDASDGNVQQLCFFLLLSSLGFVSTAALVQMCVHTH